MTQGEIDQIVAIVLQRIREYSARVVDLTEVGSLPPGTPHTYYNNKKRLISWILFQVAVGQHDLVRYGVKVLRRVARIVRKP